MANGFDPSRSPGHGVLLAKGFHWNGELERPVYERLRDGGFARVQRDTRGGWLLFARSDAAGSSLALVSVYFDTLGRLAKSIGT